MWRHWIVCIFVITTSLVASNLHAETWRGLTIAPESRCSEYNRKRDYKYPQSVELEIIASIGKIYSPYTGRCFQTRFETDIEHIIAMSEAHDSGLCAADRETRSRFARDIRNLTLASPQVNRHQKRHKDASEWLPELNKCWFAARVLEVRKAYGLTIDVREAAAIDHVLAKCESTEMEINPCPEPSEETTATNQTSSSEVQSTHVLSMYDDNGNGAITCAEARKHGIAPVHRDHPAYQFMRDGDGDGVVCE